MKPYVVPLIYELVTLAHAAQAGRLPNLSTATSTSSTHIVRTTRLFQCLVSATCLNATDRCSLGRTMYLASIVRTDTACGFTEPARCPSADRNPCSEAMKSGKVEACLLSASLFSPSRCNRLLPIVYRCWKYPKTIINDKLSDFCSKKCRDETFTSGTSR